MRGFRSAFRRRFSSGPAAAGVPVWKKAVGGVVFAGTASFVFSLGVWQMKRSEWKRDLIAHRSARMEEPVAELSGELVRSAGVDALEWRRVTVEGEPLYDGEVALGPRTAPEKADPKATIGATHGRSMLTAVRLADGSVVYVNRGWVPDVKTNATWPEVPFDCPDCRVRFTGVVRRGEAQPAYLEDGRGSGVGVRDWHWLDIGTLQRTRENVLPVVVDAVEPAPPTKEGWPIRKRPDSYLIFNIMPFMHHIYAATWFALSAGIVGVGAVLFRRLRVPAGRRVLSPSDIYRRQARARK